MTFLLLQHLLPLNIVSSSGVKVTYNAADYTPRTTFGFAANYAFHNEETCGTRRISSPIGIFFSII